MPTQLWIINNRPVGGPSPISREFMRNQVVLPRQYAYFCPSCGDIWARRVVTPATPWFAWALHCNKPGCREKASKFMNPPGTVSLLWDTEFMLNLPLPVLKHDIETICKDWDL